MSKILNNIYNRSIVTVFGTAFLVVFGDCGNLFFDEKIFKILYLCFRFIQKTAELFPEKIPELRNGWS